jgi:type VI secretion system protein ImpM
VDVGLYGKLPSHGDFLRRRTSDGFVEVWDPWLQQCIASSRATLGDRWLDLYLTSPAWRFVCSPTVCGPSAVMGLMVPSVDRVGRYFPLTIVAEAPDGLGPLVAATEGATFFSTAEQLLVDTLAEEEIDFERFDTRVLRLRDELVSVFRNRSVVLEPEAAALLAAPCDAGWQMPLGSVEQLGSVWAQIVSHRLSALYAPVSVWWTDGSAAVEPSCLIAKGLPSPDTFKTFLDGGWAKDGWHTVPAIVDVTAPSEETLRTPILLACRSAGQTDVGRVRSVNQDAFLERSDAGLWVVADGLGGHADGDVASRMVCDALMDFTPSASLDDVVEEVRQRLHDVNDHLLRTSARSLRGAKIGSTVVVLLIRQNQCAAMWAGDSRIYRLRDGKLAQITIDHSAAISVQGVRVESNVVTRAIGVSPALMIDEIREEVHPGDRFLLCSDGLTRKIPDTQIEAWMQHDDIEVAVEGLIEATLSAGAPDNVTVLIVEALADSRVL